MKSNLTKLITVEIESLNRRIAIEKFEKAIKALFINIQRHQTQMISQRNSTKPS